VRTTAYKLMAFSSRDESNGAARASQQLGNFQSDIWGVYARHSHSILEAPRDQSLRPTPDAYNVRAQTREDFALPIQGQVIVELRDEDMSDQTGAEHAAIDRMRRRGLCTTFSQHRQDFLRRTVSTTFNLAAM